MDMAMVERAPREFVRGVRGNLRVVVRGSDRRTTPDLDAFVERMRCDAFALYAEVRAAQRERDLPAPDRLLMLAVASDRATRLAAAIDAWRDTVAREDEREFAVPI